MKRQKNSHGTARSSRLTRSQSSTTRNNQQQSQSLLLSRFFKKVEPDPDDQQNLQQSIYNDAITEPQVTSSHNLSDDFVSPPKAKVAKIFTDVKERKATRATRSKSGSKTTRNHSTNEEKKLLAIGQTSDVNMEHLQLAMAMSKSMEPELCAAQNMIEDDENIYPSTQQIGENARLGLLGYRINSIGQRLSKQSSSGSGSSSGPVKVGSRRKKSKFQYVKPTLFTRTVEERERIMQDKIAQILSYSLDECPRNKENVEEIHSFVLQDNVNRSRRVFNMSKQVQREVSVYYVGALNLEQSVAKCGCLLKNWALIPGRDHKNFGYHAKQDGCKSALTRSLVPDVDNHTNLTTDTITSQFESVSQEKARKLETKTALASQPSRKTTRCESPDLFPSSDEDCDDVLIVNQTKFENLGSASLLSNINAKNVNANHTNHINDSDVFEDDGGGICTYESFCDYDYDRFDTSVSDDNVFSSPKTKHRERSSKAAITEKKQTNSETNEQLCELEDEQMRIDGAADANCSDTNVKESNHIPNNVNNSKINDSDQSYINDSLVLETRKSWNTMNVTHHVEALLNSETFINDYKSICIEKYFNSSRNQNEDETEDKKQKDKEEVCERKQDIDLSQEKVNCDSGSECIDLSQDSNDAADCATRKPIPSLNSCSLQRNLSSKSMNSTASTNESICISDEELNYSCLNATPSASSKYSKLAKKKNKFAISDSEEDDDDNACTDEGNMDEINVTRLLEQIRESNYKRSEKTIPVKIYCGYGDDREEFDHKLQEALKLSLMEAENDEERRQKAKTIEHSNEQVNIIIADEKCNRLEKQDGDSAEVLQNGGLDAVDDFADSFPSFQVDIDTNDYDNNEISDEKEIAINPRVADVSMEVNDQTILHNADTELNFNNSFPSFDHDNYDHFERNFSSHHCATPKDVKPTSNNQLDEFDLLVECDDSVFNKHSAHRPQCRRVQELINTDKTPMKQLNNTHSDDKSKTCDDKRSSVTFEDTFANLLEQTNVLKNLDNIEVSDNQFKTPSPSNKALKLCADTPATPADGLYVKTSSITPMPLFDQMTTPEIHSELDKYGLKRMKRRRGVQMLKHVYNSMHLHLEKQNVQENDVNRPRKRRKKLNYDDDLQMLQDGGPTALHPQSVHEGNIEINACLADAEAVEDMIIERKRSKRIKSCALPFHIAWHNFLCVNRKIWENVLLYEPLQVEVLYAMFKELGFKYHIQDMIAFFDRKCITIRIKQKN